MSKSEKFKPDPKRLNGYTAVLHALTHPLRLQIVGFIDRSESACVNEIFAELNIEQSLASQHLRILRQAKLVDTRRQGKFVYYTLNYPLLLPSVHMARRFAELTDAPPH